LLAFPAMDQPWLAAVEHAVPGAALAFLDHEEREEYAESREGVAEGEAELERVTQMRDDVQWGRRVMSPDMQERLRQYIAGRQEMVTGDRLVLRALRQKADRKSTRLNSSHDQISYAVFCLKKKKKKKKTIIYAILTTIQ